MKTIQYKIINKNTKEKTDYKFEEVKNNTTLKKFAQIQGFTKNESTGSHGVKIFENENNEEITLWYV